MIARAILTATAVVCFSPIACQAEEVPIIEDFVSALEIPLDQPSKVSRMDLDVTKDGKPELFLATSYLGGAFGQSWVVYTPEASGKYRRLGVLAFHYEAFYYSSQEDRFSVYVRVDRERGGFTRYRIGPEGFKQVAEPYGSLDAEKNKVEAWKREGRPPLYWTSLDELRKSSSPIWRDSATNEVQPTLGQLVGVVIR